jgi:hypothetical protein
MCGYRTLMAFYIRKGKIMKTKIKALFLAGLYLAWVSVSVSMYCLSSPLRKTPVLMKLRKLKICPLHGGIFKNQKGSNAVHWVDGKGMSPIKKSHLKVALLQVRITRSI